MKTDTIAAIATALNNSSIGVIRISGDNAISIIDNIYKSKTGKKRLSKEPSHTIHYGYIYDGDKTIDEVMVLIMRAPNSYTKEDIIEIDCHGGVVVTKKILETVIKNGARAAEPGEFTKRAFLNGRIDLSQAEAVIDIINAKNEFALQSSINQLKGTILKKIRSIRESIIRDIAFIEAALDDPEHISIDGFSEELLNRVNNNKEELKVLLQSVDNGRLRKEGIQTVILGKPNAGKSSLMNVMVGSEKAIVTEIAGTTRDTLEETINIDGIMLNIIDTAGIRNTDDIVEKIGVSKAREFADKADLVIYVVDASTQLDENDYGIIEFIRNKKAIVLLNKSDLNKIIKEDQLKEITNKCVISISAKHEQGIDLISKEIQNMFFKGKLSYNDEIYITNIRHKAAIEESIVSLKQVKESIEMGMPEDFYSIDLMNAYEILGKIIGESVEDDLVNTIFREFCMGK